jgi:Holliday junction resolvase
VNRAKQKGTSWESAIVAYLRERGVTHAERRTLAGVNDRGDIAGIPGVVMEAKNCKSIDLGGWVTEMEREQVNDMAKVGVVWAKRRGHTSAGKGYVIMTGDTFVDLITQAGYLT